MVFIFSLLTGKKTHAPLNVVLVQKQISIILLCENISIIFVGFENGLLNAYHLWNKKLISSYPGHESAVISISVVVEFIISCSNEYILVQDVKSSFLLSKINCVRASPQILKIVPNTEYYYVGYKNGELCKYLIHSTEPLACIIAHSGIITGLEIDNIALVTSGLDRFVRIWNNVKMDDECYLCLEHDSCVTSISLSQNHVISCTNKAYVYIWNMVSGIKLRTLEPCTRPIFSYNIHVFSYYSNMKTPNAFVIVTIIDLEIRIIQFLQYENKESVRINQIPKQLKATMRGTNIHSRFITAGVPDVLRLDRKVQRLALLKMRGCTDYYLRGNENEESITSFVPILLENRVQKQRGSADNLSSMDDRISTERQPYTFPRCRVFKSNTLKSPCELSTKILVRPPNKSFEKRFEKKNMVQIIHPYRINL